MKTKILIIEPSEVIAEGLKVVFSEQTRYRILEPLTSLDDVDSRLSMFDPDIVILNPTLPGVNEFFMAHADDCNIVALAYQFAPQSVMRQFDMVIDITDSRGSILDKVVRLVGQASKSHTGNTNGPDDYELTKRETSVLVLVAKGLMNKEIAETLNVSVHTVITHRKNIMHKTGIKSVAGLTIYAMLHNLIDDVSVIG